MRGDRYVAVRVPIERLSAVILLILALPLLAATSIIVKSSMGSPVLFTQARVGRNGRHFRLFKFRTMVHGAEQAGGGYMPPELDLIPPLGKFLRRTSIDEIPQLLNIIRGEMSFVGPRPALPSQYARYTEFQKHRVDVPPGVTGLAQVRYRNDAPWSARIVADVEYVENISPILDLKILFATIATVFGGRGIRHDQTVADVDDLGHAQPEERNDEQ
ncbi:sugar transferase [Leifsonia flava]|uniref:sugar transferase n=1 Tax=Orlajensenia leifsoniae TaxID=2561933 RepID=UPI001430CD44|nr:sugar transferase [Leifsonia flava]